MKATKIARGNPLYWWVSQLFLEKSKPKYLLIDEEPREAQIVLQQYFQHVESLSPENRLSKFCKEAGFMRVVEVGQYFVTRNASEFQHTIACREYTPSTRRQSFSTKRVDPRKYENWTCIGSHDKLSALQVRN